MLQALALLLIGFQPPLDIDFGPVKAKPVLIGQPDPVFAPARPKARGELDTKPAPPLPKLEPEAPPMPRIDDAKPMSATIKRLPTVNDALALAVADLRGVPTQDRPFIRYLWISSGDPENAKAISKAMNVISRGSLIHRPTPVQKGPVLLMRADLRAYAPRLKDLEEWGRLWEELQFDPRFSLLITKGTLKAAIEQFPDWQGRGFVVKRGDTGHTITEEDVTMSDLKDVELIRLPSPALDTAAYSELVNYTNSQSPVVTDVYFASRALTSIRDKGVYEVIYGGLYYQFAGIRKGAKKGATDEDALLENLGVGNIEKGITAKRIFDDLRSDQRAAIFRSQVTGSPRRMDFFRTLAGRLDVGSGLISITHDLKNQAIDVDTHPLANLLDFKDDAREVIFEKPNGMHGYALFNGEGVLQDEVPPDVAIDRTIPAPHTARLQAALSCIACHEAEGSDGWKRVTNDVRQLVTSRGRLDIFGDVSKLRDSVPDTLDRLAGLYQGDPERALSRGRDDYAAAVLRATGPWAASKVGNADVVKHAGQKLVSLVRTYQYDLVSTSQALRELGIDASEADALPTLTALLQPDKRAAVPVPEIGETIVPEDFRTAAVKAGIPIGRYDFDLQFSFMYERSQKTLATLPKK